MFGPFKATSPNLGGLLWKIPWKLSRPQKARHRRRLQHVDAVVNVLDTALRQQHRAQLSASGSASARTASAAESSSDVPIPPQLQGLTSSEIAQTAEGARLLDQQRDKAILARRSGRGPKQGEILPDLESLAAEPGAQISHRKRLRLVADQVRELGTFGLLERWKADMPTEGEMLPRDKYTIFDRKARGYRKGIHSQSGLLDANARPKKIDADVLLPAELPKWTRVSQRLNPPGF